MKRIIPTALALSLLLSTISVPGGAQAATPLVTARSPYTAFSPDGDGYRDTAPVTYRLSARSRVWVRVYRGTTLVRTLVGGKYLGAGTRTVAWNGRAGNGSQATDGAYRWIVTAKRGTRTVNVRGALSLARVVAPATVRRWIGSYVPGAPASIAPIVDLESKIGTRTAVTNYFQCTTQGFTRTQAGNVTDRGSVPLITLELWDPAKGVDQPSFSLKSIAAGSQDAYLRQYAADAAAFGKTVWLRPFHEMNGDWYPWGGTVNGNAPEDFVAAWRHVRAIFTDAGATNVQFVWAPNVDSVPNTAANAIPRYWPGDGYVDLIALDGYNFGGSTSSWRSFDSVFGDAYATVTALSPKPVFIAETACGTVGGDKSAWIADMFAAIPARYPRITGVTWFNANKERDWRVESSSATLQSFQTGLAGF